jgi:hypothetical protein
MGIMGVYFNTHDTNPVYGIKVEAFSFRADPIGSSWVRESYSPPMTETVVIVLPREAAGGFLRCTVFGPNLAGKWKDAYFEIIALPPKIEISIDKPNINIDWPDYGQCWQLQSSKNLIDWFPSKRVVPMTNQFHFFRLWRDL